MRSAASFALAIVIMAAASPGLGDPTVTSNGSTACWAAGTAPGLFDWRATPGIACRDSAVVDPVPATGPIAGPDARKTRPAASAPRSQVTFSGNAYFGIVAVF